MKRWFLIVGLILLGLVLLPILIGYTLPRDHVATSTITLRQPPDSVWVVVQDFGRYGEWWEYVDRMEPSTHDGRPIWNQYDSRNQVIPYEVVESDPPRRLVTRIVDAGLPFGGTWTYEVARHQDGSTVTITEDGAIYNPVFRVVARFIMGYHGTMDGYLTALGRRFGEDVTPVHRN